jgi:general secretion pathway protein G
MAGLERRAKAALTAARSWDNEGGDKVRNIRILNSSSLRKKASGFTLLELLVVVAIIGLLASYVGPKYFSQIGKSEQGVAKAQIESFAKALDQMRLDIGRYPTTAEGLKALMERPAGLAKWSGPYLAKALPLDPWGKAYTYKNPGTQGRDFDIISYGSDGQPGGTDSAADVFN